MIERVKLFEIVFCTALKCACFRNVISKIKYILNSLSNFHLTYILDKISVASLVVKIMITSPMNCEILVKYFDKKVSIKKISVSK